MNKETITQIYNESDKNYHLIAQRMEGLTTKEVFLTGVQSALMIVNALNTFNKDK